MQSPPSQSSATEPRFPFSSLPRGWFAVAFSDELEAGHVLPLRYFGRELIAYRTESGRARVTDAYCPHLGAHLGHGGQVEGETIRCPFHGWRFDPEGRCASIPYSQHIPPRAALESFEVSERDGVIHVFYDSAGGPSWDLPALEHEGWTPGRRVHWRGLRTHAQEIFENTVDVAHIGPVHDGRGARLIGQPRREGPELRVDIEFEAPGDVVGMPDQLNDVHLSVRMLGLGWVHVDTHVRNVDVRARQRILVTPIDEESVDIRAIVHVRETGDPGFTEELDRIFHAAYVEDFAKDFPIWEHKRYLTRPRIAKGDGPIGTYRKWCEQFYVEPATEAPARPHVSSTRLRTSARRALDTIEGRLRALMPSRALRADPPVGRGATPTEPERGKSASAPTTEGSSRPPVASAREYRETLAERFVPEAAKGIEAIFQWELEGEGGEVFHARVEGPRIEVGRGAHPKPNVTLRMSAEDYLQVLNGELDGMKAFTSGRGQVGGSLRLAMKMRTLFPA